MPTATICDPVSMCMGNNDAAIQGKDGIIVVALAQAILPTSEQHL